jgi:hypothetical protein
MRVVQEVVVLVQSSFQCSSMIPIVLLGVMYYYYYSLLVRASQWVWVVWVWLRAGH